MSFEAVKVIAAKYNAEQRDVHVIFDVAASTSSQLNLSIKNGMVFYLLEYGGNATTSDVEVVIRTPQGQILASFTEFPDFFHSVEFFMFMKNSVKTQLQTVATNGAGVPTTLTLFVRGIIIQEADVTSFENDLLTHFGVGEIIKTGDF